MTSTAELTAIEMASRMRAGSLTAEAVARACLERVEAREHAVQAWAYLDPDAVLAQARRLDDSGAGGLLHGIPVGVKDIIDTFDMPTGYGSDIYAHHQSATDAAVVALTRHAGAVIFGKTVTTEFATYTPNKTRNPHDPKRTPGGSSSGSAAAVADGMVPLAFGTQTAGSIIRPAAFCGVVGYKPTYGLLATAGVKQLAWSLDTVGVFARSVPDAAFMTGVLSDRALHAAMGSVTRPRIGICRTPHWDAATAAAAGAFDRAVAQLAEAGAEISEIVLPDEFDILLDAQKIIMGFEAARALAFERLRHADALSEPLRSLLEEGVNATTEVYDAAVRTVRVCRERVDAVMADVDALLTLSAPDEAPEGMATGDPVFNRIWTALGTPCVNVPGATGGNGMPLGIQVVGLPNHDARALSVAEWIASKLNA